MSARLERLVIQWRDEQRERARVLHLAPINVTPMEVAMANGRAEAATAALMKYAEEEMG